MIRKIDINDVSSSLGEVDAFICCASFESRSAKICQYINTDEIKEIILCVHKEYKLESNDNSKQIKNQFLRHPVNESILSTENPLESADSLRKRIDSLKRKKCKRIAVDITTFTRETLLILLKLIHNSRRSFHQVSLLYNPAKAMAEDWLSRGVKSIRGVLGFPGEILPSKPLHLVLVAGFELDRAHSVILQNEPDLISIARGSQEESICHEFSERNERLVKNLSSFYGKSLTTFTCSVTDPYKTRDDIKRHITDSMNDYNIVISGLNTKISTVGIGLLAMQNPKIQLCYSSVTEYNIKYSEPSDVCYIMEIDWNK